ncbi:MAG: GTPase Era [Solirubrobacteraceae bacterium]|nr:GTPase Era [Solirubrobacteraceae bacterium]
MNQQEPQYGPNDGVELPIPTPPGEESANELPLPGEHPGGALRAEGAPEGRTRSGFVALAGRPNVGKSTLVNAVVGHKVAIVSDKPQTTRRAIRGVCTGDDFQLVLVDLPGVQRPRDTLTERMQRRVEHELRDCDAVFFLVNAEEGIGPGDRWIAEALKAANAKVVLVVNKIDRLSSTQLIKVLDETNELGLNAEVFPISARYEDHIEPLVDHMVELLPEGPFYFDSRDATDQRIEILLAELVREQVLRRTFQEVPHSVEVEVSSIDRREDGLVIVEAAIWVETDSQQGILIGKGGDMVKRVGQAARPEIENELGERIHLDLKVRVRKNWRREDRLLDRLGIE